MIRDIRAIITYFDEDDFNDTWTRGEEHWLSEFDYRQYIHLNSDRIKSLEVLKW